MLADVLRTLYGYNRWANERMLDAAERLTPEQLNAPGQAGHGSVRDTLIHIFETHRRWLSWWDGSLSMMDAYNLKLDRDALQDVAGLREVWQQIDRQTEAFVSGLTDDAAARVYSGEAPGAGQVQLPLWLMMQHVANHGTQHRGEVAAMLTAFGHSPGDVDLTYYYFTAAPGPSVRSA